MISAAVTGWSSMRTSIATGLRSENRPVAMRRGASGPRSRRVLLAVSEGTEGVSVTTAEAVAAEGTRSSLTS